MRPTVEQTSLPTPVPVKDTIIDVIEEPAPAWLLLLSTKQFGPRPLFRPVLSQSAGADPHGMRPEPWVTLPCGRGPESMCKIRQYRCFCRTESRGRLWRKPSLYRRIRDHPAGVVFRNYFAVENRAHFVRSQVTVETLVH
jgi:hypothetical protein